LSQEDEDRAVLESLQISHHASLIALQEARYEAAEIELEHGAFDSREPRSDKGEQPDDEIETLRAEISSLRSSILIPDDYDDDDNDPKFLQFQRAAEHSNRLSRLLLQDETRLSHRFSRISLPDLVPNDLPSPGPIPETGSASSWPQEPGRPTSRLSFTDLEIQTPPTAPQMKGELEVFARWYQKLSPTQRQLVKIQISYLQERSCGELPALDGIDGHVSNTPFPANPFQESAPKPFLPPVLASPPLTPGAPTDPLSHKLDTSANGPGSTIQESALRSELTTYTRNRGSVIIDGFVQAQTLPSKPSRSINDQEFDRRSRAADRISNPPSRKNDGYQFFEGTKVPSVQPADRTSIGPEMSTNQSITLSWESDKPRLLPGKDQHGLKTSRAHNRHSSHGQIIDLNLDPSEPLVFSCSEVTTPPIASTAAQQNLSDDLASAPQTQDLATQTSNYAQDRCQPPPAKPASPATNTSGSQARVAVLPKPSTTSKNHQDQNGQSVLQLRFELVKAIRDQAPGYGLLEFERGAILAVTEKRDSGWWEGTYNGASGGFSKHYCVHVGWTFDISPRNLVELNMQLSKSTSEAKDKPFICPLHAGTSSEEPPRFPCLEDFKNHLTQVHLTNEEWICPSLRCEFRYGTESEARRHLKSNHGRRTQYGPNRVLLLQQRQYACGFFTCKEIFDDADDYCEHLASHVAKETNEKALKTLWKQTTVIENLLNHPDFFPLWNQIVGLKKANRIPGYEREFVWDLPGSRVLQQVLERYQDADYPIDRAADGIVVAAYLLGLPERYRNTLSRKEFIKVTLQTPIQPASTTADAGGRLPQIPRVSKGWVDLPYEGLETILGRLGLYISP
jgi:hypothetical protein